jgi:hypothetical protein
MAINVYWACLEDEWQRAPQPSRVSQTFFGSIHPLKNENPSVEEQNGWIPLKRCPAFNSYLKNMYEVKSLYDYSFFSTKDGIMSNTFDANFFKKHVSLRSVEKKSFSFLNRYIFFSDCDSLEMTAYIHPVFENNGITRSCVLIPGTYDIAKWFRPLEMAFYLKDGHDVFSVEHNDVLFYIKFHTDKKINFIQFKIDDEIAKMYEQNVNLGRTFIHKPLKLIDYYNMFKSKKFILKKIKENIVE